MRGVVRFRSAQGQHVAIETEDGDFAVVRVEGAELQVNDHVFGDLINPGRNVLRRPENGPIPIYLQACRLREDAAKEQIECPAEYIGTAL